MGRAQFEKNLNSGSKFGTKSSVMPNAQEEIKFGNSTPPLPSADVDNPKNIDRLAKSIYKSGRLYTGTNEKDAADKREKGMDPTTKTHSSTLRAIEEGYFEDCNPEDLDAFLAEALQHYYFTEQKEGDKNNLGATDYATLNSSASGEDSPPKLLRTFGLKKTGLIESDPDSEHDNPAIENPAWRTKDLNQIPKGYVLPSKNDPVEITEASEAFKEAFNNSSGRRALKINTTITSQQAAEMLREQQTPSAIDFKEIPPWEK